MKKYACILGCSLALFASCGQNSGPAPAGSSVPVPWTQTSGAFRGAVLSFAASPNEAGGTDLFAGTGGEGVLVSKDGGASWAPAGLAGKWITSLAASPKGAGERRLFAGTGGEGIFLSADRGASWAPAGLTGQWITALAATAKVLIAGTFEDKAFRSTDGGASWTEVQAGPHTRGINALVAVGNRSGGTDLLAATVSGVFRSTDDGAKWASASSGLTYPVHALAAGPSRTGGADLFTGTQGGVFRSIDNGAAWTPTGLTYMKTFAFAVVPDGSGGASLFAGIWGRGVFVSADHGETWAEVNDGLTNKRVFALVASPGAADGSVLLAGTLGGVFRMAGLGQAETAAGAGNAPVHLPAVSPFLPTRTIRAARVLDGRGGVIKNGVIAIFDSKIATVDQRTGPVTYDLGDATVLPGLIDVHVHLTYPLFPDPLSEALWVQGDYYSGMVLEAARATLLAGFTTVQSLGDADDKPLRDSIAAGLIVGPRVLTSFAPIWAEKRTPDELRADVRKAKADGADAIKFFASDQFLSGGQKNVTQEQANAVCAEAKALGLRCVVHAHSSDAIITAVKAGCTSIEHGFFADDAAIRAMAKAHVYFDPNIGAALQVELEHQPLPPSAMAKIEWEEPYLRAVFQKAMAAGLRMPMGTDMTGGGHGQNAREIIARVEAGQKPMDAIIGATSLAAESLRLEKTIGTIAPGYEADIIAVRGNPVKDITALRDVTFVMKGGKIYKR